MVNFHKRYEEQLVCFFSEHSIESAVTPKY